jgi:hypothetical protein
MEAYVKHRKLPERRAVTSWPAAVAAAVVLLLSNSPASRAVEQSAEKLAKETQNPVANLISVPFQNNFNFGAGPDRDLIWIMNVQPVIPIPLGEDWNLITRTILPIVNQPGFAPGEADSFGMGDVNPSVFLSPAAEAGFIWGIGLTTTLPTSGCGCTDPGSSARSPTSNGRSPAGTIAR